ncbi:MAG: xanthine dehydrogenase family protein subunit M [Deltaproteobacteria bacterium]|nr:MAG: xanthine dehydrogenase family protein subunit M [Deltaproteobacteria bacterium]
MVLLKRKRIFPDVLISLRSVPNMAYIKDEKDKIRIGSMTTHRELETSTVIKEKLTALYDAVINLGSVQIRNVATIGGNIANAAPSADTACPLLVLDASCLLISSKGEREVELKDFFIAPGETVMKQDEILKEFIIPKPSKLSGSAYWKLSRRKAMDLPILGVAISLAMNEDKSIKKARIGLGVAAPTPIRAFKAEEFLTGKFLTDEVLAEAGNIASKEASPRDSIRGEAWYRREMIRVLTKRVATISFKRANIV